MTIAESTKLRELADKIAALTARVEVLEARPEPRQTLKMPEKLWNTTTQKRG